jgi:hypothetical protein
MKLSRKTKIIYGVLITFLIVIGTAIYFELPINKVPIRSELVMLGDFNNDQKWDKQDEAQLEKILQNPFSFSRFIVEKADINRNGLLDEEDVAMLRHLYAYSDPYAAEKAALEQGMPFPRPRELFHYRPAMEYAKRPLFALHHAIAETSPLTLLHTMKPNTAPGKYQDQLLAEIYNEALRFSFDYEKREAGLTEVEKTYADKKMRACDSLYRTGDYYTLLLNLIALVEDAETLTTKGQSQFVAKTLFFRDDLRGLLTSPVYAQFEAGRIPSDRILDTISTLLDRDLSMKLDMKTLAPPRDYLRLENYVNRAEWQYYKTKTKIEAFEKLILYAQYDQRYLRAAAKTTRKHDDPELKNHNLPMMLLFREALVISGGDKKAAIGLLDEAIRIPYGWIKSIPSNMLPKSLALENFLLPGNKEDGSDKSRHWNVFGGICLYKSPEESLVLALSRELQDLKESNNSVDAMTEYIRDTIANINGIYHVVSVNPEFESVDE